MPDGSPSLTLTLHQAIGEISPADWDACAGVGNPFVSHAFLSAVEDSGSATARTGWLPQHAVLRDAKGRVAAVAPMYAKAHSYGEYVFDHGWADAFERAGGRYYPKLQVASPFSPVPGPRLLVRDVPKRVLAGALVRACEDLSLSSVHATFCNADDFQAFGQAGWLLRLGMQFHWENAGLRRFRCLSGGTERAQAENHPARAAGGTELRPGIRHPARRRDRAERVGRFLRILYVHLGPQVGIGLPDPALLHPAGPAAGRCGGADDGAHEARVVAGALNLLGSEALYGRNWGCRETGRSCILNSAITAPSRSPSRRACRGSRPGRRASTRSSAAICRSRPSRRTGSPTPGCVGRWPGSWSRNGWKNRRRWRNLRRSRRSGGRARAGSRAITRAKIDAVQERAGFLG